MENWKRYLTEQKGVDWTVYGAPAKHGFGMGSGGEEWDVYKTKTLEEIIEHFFPFGTDNLTGYEPCGNSMEDILKRYTPEKTAKGLGQDCAMHVVLYRYHKGIKVK